MNTELSIFCSGGYLDMTLEIQFVCVLGVRRMLKYFAELSPNIYVSVP